MPTPVYPNPQHALLQEAMLLAAWRFKRRRRLLSNT